MSLLIMSLLIGILIGLRKILSQGLFRIIGKLTFASILFIIAALGAKITLDEAVLNSIGVLSIKALVLMFSAVAGSVIVVWLMEKRLNLLECDPVNDQEDPLVTNDSSPVQASNYSFVKRVLITLLIGGILGKLVPIELKTLDLIITVSLYILCFGVGTEIGNDEKLLKSLRGLSWKCILVPFGVLLGSSLGGFLASLFISVDAKSAIAIGAACGFYSVAGGVLASLVGSDVGTIAFLTNFFREIGSFLIIPILATKVSPISASTPGGATAMDTTLPLIFKSLGTRVALIAMISGVVLTIIVPILLPIILSF
ncbi:MAG: lysine exporter LysO family protein [Clostridia bacterium]|nr:lysine exporter LysO family protein [Clostridia bacterium]